MKKSKILILFFLLYFSVFANFLNASVFISGVQMKGSDVMDPNPRKSKYLKTFSGGFGYQRRYFG
jgi:hypothetical protein